MNSEQYQKTVNDLDKEIVLLEKKKADATKRSADELKKASSIQIGKNASMSVLKNKMRQIEQHKEASNRATSEIADLEKKIADKRIKRNEAYLKLQKASKEEQRIQDREIKRSQTEYEKRIQELSERLSLGTKDLCTTDFTSKNEEYDVFVSHASEDKESFVDEFVKELESHNVKVWYDKSQIKWGDSLRERIDKGLRKSRLGIVVLSPDYISDGKYWTKSELDGLFQMESINGKMILPIWHKLSKQEVIDYSPVIADRLAMSTALMTPKEIADELISILASKTTPVET